VKNLASEREETKQLTRNLRFKGGMGFGVGLGGRGGRGGNRGAMGQHGTFRSKKGTKINVPFPGPEKPQHIFSDIISFILFHDLFSMHPKSFSLRKKF
jgi:hypothetical protein